jgi:hypothetical protein
MAREEQNTSADAFIAAIRMMEASELEERIAKHATVTLQDALVQTLAAGETPEGKPWAPLRKGGGRAYPDASGKITTKSTGNYVRVVLTGNEVYGHFGRTGKQVARPMLPSGGGSELPPLVSKALDEAALLAVEDVK